jgi:hypothetical protein
MWTLEELLFRKQTCESALRSISLLGEAENEGIANNATGVFKECFNPLHPQFPLSLERRLAVLREGLAADKSEQMNVLAVKGIAEAFDLHAVVALRRSEGAVPLDSRPEMKWGEMWDYWKTLATLAWETCRSNRQTVSEQARTALPRILYGLVAQTPPLEAARFCKMVVNEVLKEKLDISLNELCANLILGQQVADYFLAESQRRAVSGNLKALSFTGWVIFCSCLAVVLALPFQSKWGLAGPVFSPLFFLVCAVAYLWWGVGLLRNPESFLKRTTEPWSRLPTWAVKCFGSLLLLGAVGFSYGFALKIKALLR